MFFFFWCIWCLLFFFSFFAFYNTLENYYSTISVIFKTALVFYFFVTKLINHCLTLKSNQAENILDKDYSESQFNVAVKVIGLETRKWSYSPAKGMKLDGWPCVCHFFSALGRR